MPGSRQDVRAADRHAWAHLGKPDPGSVLAG
jgi:hypothetical protein